MQKDFTYKGNLVVATDLIAQYDEADLRLSHYFHHTKGSQRRPVKRILNSIFRPNGAEPLPPYIQMLSDWQKLI